MNIDWTAIATAIVSAVLGIGVVATFLSKYLPKVIKYVSIAKDALNLASDAIAALDDKTITEAEIVQIKADYAKIQADFKA